MKYEVDCPMCDGTGDMFDYVLPKELTDILRSDPYHELFLISKDPNWKEQYKQNIGCFNCEGKGTLSWED